MINLMRMELCGFKSFADRTVINFTGGLTGVVGPNGCGKSNIVDAVRWVLGEPSKKNIRAVQGQDVIFNGTETRRPATSCEVFLYFDNSERVFNHPDDEFSVGRRLYRSGDSEYLINGKKTQRKEILALFKETGVGKDGYSIIAQGKVTEIMSAKPDVRRRMFEEALNCAQFRDLKKSAEADLADSLAELEKLLIKRDEQGAQLSGLEKKSKIAKEGVEIRNALREQEINLFLYQYETLDQKKAELTAEISRCDAQRVAAETQRAALSVERTNLAYERNQLQDKKTELLSKRAGIIAQKDVNRTRYNDILTNTRRLSGEVSALRSSIAQSTVEMEDAIQTRASYESQIEEYTTLLNTLNENFREYERQHDELSAELLQLHLKSGSNAERHNELMLHIAETRENIGAYRAEYESLKERIKELNEAVQNAELELTDDTEVNESLGYDIAQQERVQHNYMVQLTQLNNSLTQARNDLTECRSRCRKLESEYANLIGQRSLFNTYSSLRPAVQKLIDDAVDSSVLRSRMEGLVSDKIKVKSPEHALAIETTLGNELQSIIVKNEEDAKYLINYVKENRYGKIKTLPLTSVKGSYVEEKYKFALMKQKGYIGIASDLVDYDKSRYEPIVRHLLGRTIIVTDMDCAIAISRNIQYMYKVVTLEGEIFSNNGTISGGYIDRNRSNTALLVSQKDLEAKLKALKEQLDEAKAEEEDLSDSVLGFENDVKTASERLNEAKTRIAVLKGRKTSLEKAIDELTERLQKLKTELAEKTARFEQLGTDISQVENLDKMLKSDTEQSSLDSVAVRDKEKELTDKLDEARAKKEQCALDKVSTENSIRHAKIEILHLTETIERLRSEIERNQKAITEKSAQIDAYNESIEDLNLSAADTTATDTIDEQIGQVDARIAAIDQRQQDLDREDVAAADRWTAGTRGSEKAAAKLESLEEDLASEEMRILVEYDLRYEDARAFRLPEFDPEEAEKNIAILRKKKKNLGDFDESTIAEYDQANARYSELCSQVDDISNAAQSLKDTIEKLSVQMQHRFNKGFAIINKNFGEVFAELFGGGRGELRLIGDDPTEQGVEIYAQPPGKRIVNLTSLSGGEQALTSIAILFAIMKMRKLPFVILDEMEAALDISNVEVYAKYLRKYSSISQFIVITHRVQTMELMDVLYGITMEKKGESMVLKVSLTEASKMSDETTGG